MLLIRKKITKQSDKFNFQAVFQIKLHNKDKQLLESMQSCFEGGAIIKDGENASVLIVRSLKLIIGKILPHFDSYPLKTKKLADYLLWKQIVLKMNAGCHLEEKGIQEIINLRASLNWGLSPELTKAFPNTIIVPRPNTGNIIVADIHPEWVAGFTSGEGSFSVNVRKSSKYKTGHRVSLRFTITQHIRDQELMKSLVDFFGCGFFRVRNTNKAGDFSCEKFSDIQEKIIPFFLNYEIKGVKAMDFKDWLLVARLIDNGEDKTEQGLAKIVEIKSRMNSERVC